MFSLVFAFPLQYPKKEATTLFRRCKNVSLFSKILQRCAILFRNLSKIKRGFLQYLKDLKKIVFIFDNFQYASSTLNFNNGGYEKTRKNYIRSFHESIEKSKRDWTNIPCFLLWPTSKIISANVPRKGMKEYVRTTACIEDRGWWNGNKGLRRLGEKRESAGWSQLHYAYDRWKAIQEAIGRRWRHATAKLTAYLVVRDAIMY